MVRHGEILIVGQGLAGSILALECWNRGIPFQIWNAPKKYFTSSFAAGGIFNPVTGRKFENTWLARELFDYLKGFYPKMEALLGERFFHESKMFRPFGDQNSVEWLEKRRQEMDFTYLDWQQEGVWIKEAGWVDVPRFLQAARDFFIKNQVYFEKEFVHSSISDLNQKEFHLDGRVFSKILFCEGFHAQKSNPFFSHLCFLPAKGELLTIQIPDHSQDYILSKNGFLLPMKNQKFKVGATYRWDEFTNQPTRDALSELESKLESFGIKEYKILQQEVGVRPATQDRRPFIGFIPGSNLGIFNGFGSKGVSLIPYFANGLVDEWEGNKNLPLDASIRRFYS